MLSELEPRTSLQYHALKTTVSYAQDIKEVQQWMYLHDF